MGRQGYEVKLAGYALASASVDYPRRAPTTFGLLRPTLREASISGVARISDLVGLQQKIEDGEPVSQAGVFQGGTDVFVTGLSLQYDTYGGTTFSEYTIEVIEARTAVATRNSHGPGEVGTT